MTPEDKAREDRKDAFEAWRADPVAKEVFAALSVLADKAKQRWVEESWGRGVVDPVLLADLRARHEVVDDLVNLTFEELEASLGQSERD